MENSGVVQRTAPPERRRGYKSAFFLPLHVKPRPGMTGLRRLTFEARVRSTTLAADFAQKMRPKRKTRPGGQPDGSSYIGAWGGWALAPNTASMGRDYRSHKYRSREGRRTFKQPTNFFNFWASIFGRHPGRNYCAAGRWVSRTADLSDAMAAPGGFKSLVEGIS